MKYRLLPLFCLFYFQTSSAQSLHVHYNVFRDSVWFSQKGKAVSQPKLKRGEEVALHVENYNNYLYEVSLKIEEETVSVAGTSGASQLGKISMGGSISPLGLLFKGNDQMMGMFKFLPSLTGSDLSEGSGFIKSEEERARQEKVAKLRKLEADFNKNKEGLFALEAEMKGLQEQLQQKAAALQLQSFAMEEVNHIRFNPYLEPQQIKQLTREYMERIFQEKDPEKIDLNAVLQISNAQSELPKAVQEYRRKAERYHQNTLAGELMLQDFKAFDFPESNLKEFRSSAEAFVAAAKRKDESLLENASMLESVLPQADNLGPKTFAALRTTYIELNNNSFSKTYRQKAKGESLKMKLKLTPNDSLARSGMKPVELAPLHIDVYGGMRVRASVGLNFGQFFNRPQTYFVRDSTLQATNKDAFQPILTSFMHFYAPSSKSVAVAGSFGVGFPLGGGESLQSVSFFLGPSLMFGSSERIVLNMGVMGGKVERLSQGYRTGDRFETGANFVPTTNVYELGFYVGVSFNVTGGN